MGNLVKYNNKKVIKRNPRIIGENGYIIDYSAEEVMLKIETKTTHTTKQDPKTKKAISTSNSKQYYYYSPIKHKDLLSKYKNNFYKLYKYFNKLDLQIIGFFKEDSIYFHDIYINDNYLEFDFAKDLFKEFELPTPMIFYYGILTQNIINNYKDLLFKSIPENTNIRKSIILQ